MPLEQLAKSRLLPIVVLPDLDCAVPLGRTLLDAGLPVLEIACGSAAAIPAIRRLRHACPELLVGAGTVLSAATAEDAIAAGAQFLIAPAMNEHTMQLAQRQHVPMLPGVLTPSEVDRARELGHRVLKLFPAAALGGASYVTMLTEIHRGIRYVPTGGIDAGNLAEYLGVSSVLACSGTWLAPQQLLRERRFDEIWSRVAAAVTTVRSAAVAS